MTVHNYRSRQVHKTLNGVNPSSSFRDMRSARSGPNLWQIWQVFGPWASPYGANDHDSAHLQAQTIPQNFEWRKSVKQLQRYEFRKFGSRPPGRPPARTVTTIPLQPEGLRGKNMWMHKFCVYIGKVFNLWKTYLCQMYFFRFSPPQYYACKSNWSHHSEAEGQCSIIAFIGRDELWQLYCENLLLYQW